MSEQAIAAGKPAKTITINLDGEDLDLPDRDTTPNEILRTAGLDPATHYLVHVRGKQQDSYQNHGDETIKVHSKDKFISLSTGPTPTS